ncbi:MAG: DUF4157 domain-containing protein [Cyanobacteria bacterium J06638_20]
MAQSQTIQRSPFPTTLPSPVVSQPLLQRGQAWDLSSARLRDSLPFRQGLQSPSQPLDAHTRLLMASRFNHDFSQVRVHTNPPASESAQAMSARAYTLGQHIVFANGHYAPATLAGQRLLAHELTHVIQQQSSDAFPAQPLAVSQPTDAAEQEARAIATQVTDGKTVQVRHRTGTVLHRDVWDWLGPTLGVVGGLAAAGAIGYGIYAALNRDGSDRSTSQDPTTFSGLSAWELAQIPADRLATAPNSPTSSTGPRNEDYVRASQFIRSLFTAYGITFDAERDTRVLGRDPTPEELAILNANLNQILGVANVRESVTDPEGRGVPTAPGSTTPSLQGRAKVLNTLAEYSIKRFQLQWLVAGSYGLPIEEIDRGVRSLWTEQGITASADARITDQERRATALVASRAHAGLEPGFYFPPNDMFYLAPGSDLRQASVQDVARHETVHLLGGRDRTRQAFVERYGTPRYINLWRPFEEGMAELINLESSPTATSPGGAITGSAYGPFVAMMRRIMGHPGVGRAILFRAYFTGIIPDLIFQRLEAELLASSSSP